MQWCRDGDFFGDFLGPAFPASCQQHISDLHSKFALGPHHVSKYGRHPICGLYKCCIIIRPHRSTTYVDAAYSYRPSSVVCRSVRLSFCRSDCLSVCHTSDPCKYGCTDRAAVWVADLGGPGKLLLDGVQIPYGKGQILGRMGVPL